MISRNWLCKPNKKYSTLYNVHVRTDLRIDNVLCALELLELVSCPPVL